MIFYTASPRTLLQERLEAVRDYSEYDFVEDLVELPQAADASDDTVVGITVPPPATFEVELMDAWSQP